MELTIRPSGVNRDISPAELDDSVWNAAQNVVFENGFGRAAPGWTARAPGALFEPLYLQPVFANGKYYWIYGGNDEGLAVGGIGLTDGSNHWDITPAGGLSYSNAGAWTGGTLNGVAFINNGLDAPLYWDGIEGNPLLELPGWPAATRCAALRAFKYHLVAMNITDGTGDYPDLVLWSDAADPGTIPQEWVPTDQNQAGNFSIASTQGEIIDGGEMRDQFAIYKSGSTTMMQYIAGTFVFSNRRAFVSSGILARNCWAELYGQHYVLTDGDFIVHNGQEVESLIDGVMRNYLFGQIDANEYFASHIAMLHSAKQVWLNFPDSGNAYCNRSIVYDVTSGAFGEVDFDKPLSFMARGIFNDPNVSGDYDNQTGPYDSSIDRYNASLFNPTTDLLAFAVYEPAELFAVEGFQREGVAVPFFLQMLKKDLGEPQRVKIIKGIWPLADNATDLEDGNFFVRVGVQDKINDPIAWTPLTPIRDNLKADIIASGRYLSLELSSSQANGWRLNSIDVMYELGGLW